MTLAAVKEGPGADAELSSTVRQVSLATFGSIPKRISAYKRMLIEAGGRAQTASISFCLSADMVNLLCRNHAVCCASIRGNLPQNYTMDYGPLGIPIALGHLLALRGMDHVVAMTTAMSAQVARYLGRSPAVIGNFVDELALEPYRDVSARKGPLRFVYLASLTRRKRPELLIGALASLLSKGVQARLDILGEGPFKPVLKELISKYNLSEVITLHGHQCNPYPWLARADVMVLPSLSEGISRAGLEALYLGIPCVMRDIDGNTEIIRDGINGKLFREEVDLPSSMLAAAQLSRLRVARANLLPESYHQHTAAHAYLQLVESV